MPCSQIRQGIKEANYISVDYLCPCSSGVYILAAISNNNKISRLANICLYCLLFIQLCRVNGNRLLNQITHNIIMQISSILHFIKMTHDAPCPCTHTLPYTSSHLALHITWSVLLLEQPIKVTTQTLPLLASHTSELCAFILTAQSQVQKNPGTGPVLQHQLNLSMINLFNDLTLSFPPELQKMTLAPRSPLQLPGKWPPCFPRAALPGVLCSPQGSVTKPELSGFALMICISPYPTSLKVIWLKYYPMPHLYVAWKVLCLCSLWPRCSPYSNNSLKVISISCNWT